MYDGPATLECQDCGDVIFELSPAQQQKVARNPYNFILLCKSCRALEKRVERFHDYGD